MSVENNKGRRNVIIYIICLFSMLCVIAGILGLSANFQNLTGQIRISNGLLDLEHAKFSEYGCVYLNGEWEYYPNQFIVTEKQADHAERELTNAPGRWEPRGSKALHERASYRVTLTKVPIGEHMVMVIPGMLTNYSMFVNGEKIDTNSQEGFIAKSAEIELVLEFKNQKLGGLYITPLLSSYGFFEYWIGKYDFVMIGLFAALILASILFFVISIAGNTKRHYKYLFLFGFMTVLRYMARVLSILPEFQKALAGADLEFLAPMTFALTISCVIGAMYMAEAMAGERGYRKFRNTMTISLIAGTVVSCIFWGPIYYDYLGILMSVLALISFGYTVRIILKAIRQQADYALMMGIGILIIFFGLAVDSLNLNEFLIFDASYVLPVCIVIFSILYSVILSKNEQKLYETMDRNIKMQKEVTMMEAAAMAQRMQPHFLYNTLTAIQELCYTDPHKAAEAVAHFSAYLRNNIDFLKQPEEISFSRELNFIRNYAEIQKDRYGDGFVFTTKIETMDFKVPPFSIEPLVENAVKYGVKDNIGNKEVLLCVKPKGHGIMITVEDNGAGFDAESMMHENEQCTLSNIRKRLDFWKGASLTIDSRMGWGTRAIVWIPSDKE